MTGTVLIGPVTGSLPRDIADLRSEATGEGFGFIERLFHQWERGETRFEKPGEALFVARRQGTLAGIGGVTVDPFDQTALRMRRFYIRPAFRRHGIARELATTLLRGALETGRPLTVNAGTETAPQFWKSMGFRRAESRHHTHVWPTVER